jgi:CheY-like chemotaxis protein
MIQSQNHERAAVLVVDDEVMIRLDIADSLQGRGFATYEAGSADEAIHLMEIHPDIRMLFTDVDMPGSMDGIKLSHYVRDRWPPVRIVVTSGHQRAASEILPEGATFIAKPYELADLKGILSDLPAGRDREH